MTVTPYTPQTVSKAIAKLSHDQRLTVAEGLLTEAGCEVDRCVNAPGFVACAHSRSLATTDGVLRQVRRTLRDAGWEVSDVANRRFGFAIFGDLETGQTRIDWSG